MSLLCCGRGRIIVATTRQVCKGGVRLTRVGADVCWSVESPVGGPPDTRVDFALNDLWTYNPTTRQWTWVSGPDVVNTNSGDYGTLGIPATTNQPGSRIFASGWTDTTGHLWLFGGFVLVGNNAQDLNDLWKS